MKKKGALQILRYRVHSLIKRIKNFPTLCYKALEAKIAKEYLQSKNSAACDILGLEEQAKLYKPEK